MIGLGGALLAALATAAIPLVQRRIIDDVIVTHRESIWPLAGLLLVAAAVNFAGIYLRRYRGGRVSLDVQHDLRTDPERITDIQVLATVLDGTPVYQSETIFAG